MPQYRFEIVGRAFGRFTWRLVELRGSRRRVLARDDQDYSTLPKVEEAIAAFRVIVGGAQVVNTTLPGATPFPLPPTRFEFVDGVVPLVVEESPEEDDELSQGPPESAHKEPARQEPARQEPARQAAEPKEPERKEQPAEPARRSRKRAAPRASTTTRERTTRSSGRRRKGT
jgi:outer membrane biosynthesis protein TonB